jgi:hypothetical protein
MSEMTERLVPNMQPEIKLLRVYFFTYDYDPDKNPPEWKASELPILAWCWSSPIYPPEPLTFEEGHLADIAADFICYDGKYYHAREFSRVRGRPIKGPIGHCSFTREEAIETALREARERYREGVERQAKYLESQGLTPKPDPAND